MKGFWYQWKNIWRDKLCILTFLLPVIVALGLRLLPGMELTALSEPYFGIVRGELPTGTERCLGEMGKVTVYENEAELLENILEPSTQMIGVKKDGPGIRTLISGDEYSLNKKIAGLLPVLEANWQSADTVHAKFTILPAEKESDALLALLAAITMVSAMFMGCTFNAMSLIKEKEDGISFINEVLPMTPHQFLVQKIMLGFLGGMLSAIATALLCIRPKASQLPFLLLLIILSTFLAALTGLFIGQFSRGLMTGIVVIKTVMILFIAPPILFYLTLSRDSIGYMFSFLLPSSAAFYGLMDLMAGETLHPLSCLLPLALHCLFWSFLYLLQKRLLKHF